MERHSTAIEKTEKFKALCKKSGLKLTHQRLVIYNELASTTDHPSAELIHKRVQAQIPTISLDTVYRTLSMFERLGFAVRVHAFDDQGRFDADPTPHHHFVCHRCKAVLDFHWPNFDDSSLPVEAEQKGKIVSKHAMVRGICRGCLAEESRPESGAHHNAGDSPTK